MARVQGEAQENALVSKSSFRPPDWSFDLRIKWNKNTQSRMQSHTKHELSRKLALADSLKHLHHSILFYLASRHLILHSTFYCMQSYQLSHENKHLIHEILTKLIMKLKLIFILK